VDQSEEKVAVVRSFAFIICAALFVSACSVSIGQMEQHGFYSETLTKEQVQAARSAGRVKSLGQFDITTMGCGDYAKESQEENLIRPAVLRQVMHMGGDAAENVALHDRPANFFIGLLVVPVAAGCTGFEITGDALKVEPAEPPPAAALLLR
jgi:hypothetical protein